MKKARIIKMDNLSQRRNTRIKPAFCRFPVIGLPWQVIYLNLATLALQKRRVVGLRIYLLEMQVHKHILLSFTLPQSSTFLSFILRGRVLISTKNQPARHQKSAPCYNLNYVPGGKIYTRVKRGEHSVLFIDIDQDWFGPDSPGNRPAFNALLKASTTQSPLPLFLPYLPLTTKIWHILGQIRMAVTANMNDGIRLLQYTGRCIRIYHSSINQALRIQKELDERGKRLKQYLAENYNESEVCTARYLQDHFSWSRWTLQRIVKHALKSSLPKYIYQLRMQKATQLLKTTRLPIKSIALKIGFSSDIAFIKAFKRYTGISPWVFRNQKN